MSLLGDRTAVDKRTPMPAREMGVSTNIVPVVGETLTITAGAAGTAIAFVLDNAPVYDSLGNRVGNNNDSSFSFGTGTIFTTQRKLNYDQLDKLTIQDLTSAVKISAITAGWANGEWALDFENGIGYGVKATNSTSETASYLTRAALQITVLAGGASATLVDDAAFTVGTSAVTPVGFLADETTTDSVDENDIGAPRMTLNRRIITAGNLLDDSTFGIGTDYVTPTGFLADETATDSVNEGDVGAARMTLNRRQIMANHFLDDSAFGIATDYVGVIGGLFDDTGTDSVDEGDIGAVRMTGDRQLRVAEGFVDGAVDNTNSVFAMTNKPLAVATYSPTRFQNLGANATLNVKATTGNILSVYSRNVSGGDRWLQLHNTATTPSPGNVPVYSFYVPAGGVTERGTEFFTQPGVNGSNGWAFAFSTTEGTYTAATATDHFTFINYI